MQKPAAGRFGDRQQARRPRRAPGRGPAVADDGRARRPARGRSAARALPVRRPLRAPLGQSPRRAAAATGAGHRHQPRDRVRCPRARCRRAWHGLLQREISRPRPPQRSRCAPQPSAGRGRARATGRRTRSSTTTRESAPGPRHSRAELERVHGDLRPASSSTGLSRARPARRPACRRPSSPKTAAASGGRSRELRQRSSSIDPHPATWASGGARPDAASRRRRPLIGIVGRRGAARTGRRRRTPSRRSSRNCASRVARPTTSGSTPVASGSSVPVWPMREIAERAPHPRDDVVRRRPGRLVDDERRRSSGWPGCWSPSRDCLLTTLISMMPARTSLERPADGEAGGVLVSAAAERVGDQRDVDVVPSTAC